MLTDKLMRATLAVGSEWVMVVLLLLSVSSLAVMIERAIFFRKRRERLDRLDETLKPMLTASDTAPIGALLSREQDATLSAAWRVAPEQDRGTAEKIVAGVLSRERLRLERGLTFLGTLGNNAPFIGLFGTVLGIIKAFHDLSLGSMAGHTAVMAGISEALVATALGLFVAIPAVIAFNYFQKQLDQTLSVTETLAAGIIAVAGHGPIGRGQ